MFAEILEKMFKMNLLSTFLLAKVYIWTNQG